MTFNKLLQLFGFLFLPKKLRILDPLTVGVGLGGLSLASGILNRNASKDAANISAGASRAATAETGRQFDITQRNLSPFLQVAVGKEQFDEEGNFTGFSGGALNTLADFGPSKIDPSQFIPESNIPQFDPNFDVFADPGVRFRQQEQERALNRQSAGLGQFLSGNRIEDILQRSGDLASQEFGAAFNRNLTEFDINRQRESTQFGRGVDAFGRAAGQESDFLNRLSSLAGIGQTSAQSLGQFGAGAAAETGANLRAAAQAQGAAKIGGAAAETGGIGDLTSLFTSLNQPPNNFFLGSGSRGTTALNFQPQGR